MAADTASGWRSMGTGSTRVVGASASGVAAGLRSGTAAGEASCVTAVGLGDGGLDRLRSQSSAMVTLAISPSTAMIIRFVLILNQVSLRRGDGHDRPVGFHASILAIR